MDEVEREYCSGRFQVDILKTTALYHFPFIKVRIFFFFWPVCQFMWYPLCIMCCFLVPLTNENGMVIIYLLTFAATYQVSLSVEKVSSWGSRLAHGVVLRSHLLSWCKITKRVFITPSGLMELCCPSALLGKFQQELHPSSTDCSSVTWSKMLHVPGNTGFELV